MNLTLQFFILVSILNIGLSAQNVEKVSLQLQWKHAFQFAGYYVAKEKGYYKEVGIDLDIKEYQYGLDIASSIEKGKSTYGVGRPSIIVDKAKGRDIILLAAIYQSSPLIVLTTNKSGINSINDFKNKTIMTVNDSSNDAAINAMLESQKFSLSNMNVIKHTFNVKDLINGKTDLLTAYIANQPYVLEKLGYKPKIFHPRDYGFDFYSDILFTSGDELKNNPQRVSDFKKVSLKGWRYAFDNIDEIVDLIYKKYNTQNLSKDALRYEAKELKKLAYYNTEKIGKIEYNKVIEILGIYNLIGTTKGKINLENLIYKSEDNDELENISLTSKQLKYLEKKEQITMCIDPDWMPFEKFDKDEHHVGISKDYFDLFQKKLDIPIKVIKTKSWSQTLQYAKNRRCDIISLAMETPMRKQYMNFTTPYLSVPLVVATKNNVSFIDDFKLLQNKKIGLVKGYALVSILKEKYTNLNIIEVENIDDGLKKVVDGKLFGFVGSIADIGYKFQTSYIGELKITGKFDERWELGTAVRNDDLELLKILEKVISDVPANVKQDIFNKYIAIKYEKGIDYSLVWKTSIGFVLALFILVFFLIRQNRLKKEIEKLNINLELKIKEEVEKNREKDKTIFRQAKLASMGEMIGNIAHQWRQPLNRINLSLAVINDVINEFNIDKKIISNKVQTAQKNLQYMSDTIEDFANFFRPDKQKTSFNLLKVINKGLKLIESKTKKIDIVLPISDDIKIKTYENELLQVFLIIINNALDNFNLNDVEYKQIKISVDQFGSNIVILIKDNSGGIKKDIIENIFDPYFTTKFKNEGTGIGLYMAKMVIEDSMHGTLGVESQNNETTLKITLSNEIN